MKIGKGGIEGTQKEVTDFFQNNGLRVSDFLTKPEPKIKGVYIALSLAVATAAIIALVFIPPSSNMRTVVFLLGAIAAGALGICVHIRFKNIGSAIIIIILEVLLMLVATGVLAPLDLLNQIKELRK